MRVLKAEATVVSAVRSVKDLVVLREYLLSLSDVSKAFCKMRVPRLDFLRGESGVTAVRVLLLLCVGDAVTDVPSDFSNIRLLRECMDFLGDGDWTLDVSE